MGNWFGKKRRGLIFGIWNTDTSVGNIIGSLVAGIWVSQAWGFSFVVPGLILCGAGICAFFLVIIQPEDVGLPTPDYTDDIVAVVNAPAIHGGDIDPEALAAANSNDNIKSIRSDGELERSDTSDDSTSALPVGRGKPVTIWRAILIPGVIEYSICLFFCKAVYYAFFFWLPVYIRASIDVENEMAADISVVFDGGMRSINQSINQSMDRWVI